METLRPKHKLHFNIHTQDEEVLCKGEDQRLAIIRFFWKNVDCQKCLSMRKSFLAKVFRR